MREIAEAILLNDDLRKSRLLEAATKPGDEPAQPTERDSFLRNDK